MPRYFFHVIDGQDLPDAEGTELTDMNAVRAEAIRASAEMLRDLHNEWNGEPWQMNVAEASGRVVYRLDFSATDLPEAAE